MMQQEIDNQMLQTERRDNGASKVVFIAGAGRSGSTLLDMLLGQIDGFCSTGELRFIWERGIKQNQLCSCEKPFKNCDFWIETIQEAFGGIQNIDYEKFASLRKPSEQDHHLSSWPLRKDSIARTSLYHDYFEAYQRLYQAILKISGREIIIDSSKNIVHAINLSSVPGIELYTVHLARDSRAVAYSWQRKKVRPEVYWEQRFMGQRGLLKSARRWNRYNMLAHKLRGTSKGYTLLKYEDLSSNPKDSLLKLLDDLKLPITNLNFLEGNKASLKTNHMVSGNPMRFMQKEIEIRPDTQWHTDMTKYHKVLVTFLTWPLLLKYGYIKN